MVDEQIGILQKYLDSLKKVYKVTFDINDGTSVSERTGIVENTKIQRPKDPTKEGYIFDGWYKSENYKDKWDFAKDVVIEDITLYAKWIEVSEEQIASPLDGEKLIEDNTNNEQDNEEIIELGNSDNNEVNDDELIESIEKMIPITINLKINLLQIMIK